MVTIVENSKLPVAPSFRFGGGCEFDGVWAQKKTTNYKTWFATVRCAWAQNAKKAAESHADPGSYLQTTYILTSTSVNQRVFSRVHEPVRHRCSFTIGIRDLSVLGLTCKKKDENGKQTSKSMFCFLHENSDLSQHLNQISIVVVVVVVMRTFNWTTVGYCAWAALHEKRK